MSITELPSPQQVRAARSLLGWSQQDLAGKAGVAVSTVADFERGQRSPMPNNALAIRQALELSGTVFTEGGVSCGFNWTFKTGEKTAALLVTFNDDYANAVADFASIFGSAEPGKVSISSVQCASPELKSAVSNFIEKHGTASPHLHRLRKMLTDLDDGEFFLILPTMPFSSADEFAQGQFLHQLNHPEDRSFEAEHRQVFGPLLEAYDLCLPRTDKRTDIGNPRKADRTCRFCRGTTKTGATFNDEAHAIPAALGNKFLKLKDECDVCNHYFGDEIEPTLIELLNIQRVFLGIEARGSRPKIDLTEGKIFHDGNRIVISTKKMSQDASGVLTAQLGSTKQIVPQNFYRALTKIALSVIPEDHLQALEKTVRWVRYGESSDAPLPKIAAAVVLLPPDPSAQITLYIRKTDTLRTPHVVCEFRLGCYMYVYALPFSTRDDWNLIEYFEEETFKSTFRHYAHVPAWTLKDYSDTRLVSLPQSIRLAPHNG